MSPLAKPVEYNPGTPLERYSAERRRRGIAAESAGYTAGALGAASGASLVGNAKIAGTKIGQHSLGVAHTKLAATGHPGAAQVARVKRIGASTARHKIRANAAMGGFTVAAGTLGMMGRMRANEEAGISQGVGRIKAGESYANTRKRTLSKGVVRTALMLSDTDVNHPALRKTAKIINEHGGKILGGTAATGAAGTVVGSMVGSKNRAVQARSLRSQTVNKAAQPRSMYRPPTRQEHREFRRDVKVGAGAGAGMGYLIKPTERGADAAFDAPAGKKAKAFRTAFSHHAHPSRGFKGLTPKTNIASIGLLGGMAGAVDAASRQSKRRAKAAESQGALHAMAVDKVKSQLSKALYSQESKPSLLRYAGMGIGGGLTAWGLGRSGMLGSALGRGVKAATARGNTNALEALRLAQATQGLLRRGTAPGERGIRQIRALNTAINRVPASIRPEIAAASGIYLMGSSHPVNRTSYRQVSTDVSFRRAF